MKVVQINFWLTDIKKNFIIAYKFMYGVDKIERTDIYNTGK